MSHSCPPGSGSGSSNFMRIRIHNLGNGTYRYWFAVDCTIGTVPGIASCRYLNIWGTSRADVFYLFGNRFFFNAVNGAGCVRRTRQHRAVTSDPRTHRPAPLPRHCTGRTYCHTGLQVFFRFCSFVRSNPLSGFVIMLNRHTSASVADPDQGSGTFLTPGSGAFLTPGSGIRCLFYPWIRNG